MIQEVADQKIDSTVGRGAKLPVLHGLSTLWIQLKK
jgi:hypothetical protein